MATICNNKMCRFSGGGDFCNLEFSIFNAYGQCCVWWDKNGQVRQTPLYDANKPNPPQEQKKVNNDDQTGTGGNPGTEG